jgi:predicted nucleic-acid-binding protein
MIGLDTNVLIRFIVVDDRDQFEKAKRFLSARTAADPAFISLMVVAELVWVLNRLYEYPFPAIISALATLLQAEELEFEQREFLGSLLASTQSSRLDIADHIISHIARQNGCSHTVTFDRVAAKTIPGMERLT